MMKSANKIVFTALAAATTALSACVLHLPLPMPSGYCHPADALIFLFCAVLPEYAPVASALGFILADLFMGAAVYLPATAVLKWVMAYIAARFLRLNSLSIWRNGASLALAESITVAGYFLYESLVFGLSMAAASLPGNLCQAGIGVVLGVFLLPTGRRLAHFMTHARHDI